MTVDILSILRGGVRGCVCSAYTASECGCPDAVWPENLIEAAADEIERLRAAVALADNTFRWYGDLHAAKPDPEKAKRNYDLANKMASALSGHTKDWKWHEHDGSANDPTSYDGGTGYLEVQRRGPNPEFWLVDKQHRFDWKHTGSKEDILRWRYVTADELKARSYFFNSSADQPDQMSVRTATAPDCLTRRAAPAAQPDPSLTGRTGDGDRSV